MTTMRKENYPALPFTCWLQLVELHLVISWWWTGQICMVFLNMTLTVELTACLPHVCICFMKFCRACGPFVSNSVNTVFTNAEYANIHFVCGYCNGDVRAVVEEYKQWFLNWRTPSIRVFISVHWQLREAVTTQICQRMSSTGSHWWARKHTACSRTCKENYPKNLSPNQYASNIRSDGTVPVSCSAC
jgi:hypothetical protein